MYFDTKPCDVCGGEVRLRAHRPPIDEEQPGPVGPSDGVVGDADSTVDERVCTNPDCPTNQAGGPGPG
ncbi:hypothetical protein [Nocardioides pantholopis]|uniref:hypothetical protein n=1 Tax=Nocardioides pantholopis TaxID=2483798 RepID=UPI000FD81D49|nr:hypothetical protein [Nocardioides pantholopis]